MLKLTPRQAEILAFIKRCLEDNGFPPTRAEIAQELGFKSPNAAEEHLKALARKGAIEMTPGASRGIRIPGLETKAEENGLPIIGRVAAGCAARRPPPRPRAPTPRRRRGVGRRRCT